MRRLVVKMHKAMPWLEPADEPACRAWAELELLGASLFVVLNAEGPLNGEGEPRRLLSEYRSLRRDQLAYERELGMTPASRMALRLTAKQVAGDINLVRAAGRDALARRELAAASIEADSEPEP